MDGLIRHLRLLAGIAGLALLCACQGTTFQTPPLAAGACDPGLSGRWISINEDGRPDGEMVLVFSADCQLDVTDRSNGNLREGDPTQVHVAQSGANGFMWVDAGWTAKRFDFADLAAHPGDVFLMRYSWDQGELLFNDMDDKAVAHLIIDGKIPGTVDYEDDRLLNRITGPARPEVLTLPGVFSAEFGRFRRDDGNGKP
ncbi:MAG: hypothetical protein A3E01_17470 [Gammaproteobacteria bacterium RIFCSPHIGHO2_12_FULL_63_22]|nr:MAG: hypothetical protein A3E01_17470 [Gammaproteobacteria bacterium RIFCSPHIGHO2_12_FULL_63_22]